MISMQCFFSLVGMRDGSQNVFISSDKTSSAISLFFLHRAESNLSDRYLLKTRRFVGSFAPVNISMGYPTSQCFDRRPRVTGCVESEEVELIWEMFSTLFSWIRFRPYRSERTSCSDIFFQPTKFLKTQTSTCVNCNMSCSYEHERVSANEQTISERLTFY